MLRFITLIFMATTIVGMAQAQTKRYVQLNLCCLRYAENQRSVFVKSEADATPAELLFYQGGFTEPVKVLEEEGKIVFYRKGEEGQALWVTDWSITVPDKREEISVILLPKEPNTQNPEPYQAYLLPTVKEFDYGTVWIANLTPLTTKLEVGRTTVTLAPGSAKNALLKPHADSYNMVPMTAWIRHEKSWHTLHTTQWPFHERYRQAALLWMDPALKRPEITTLREFRPQPPAPE
jgi:hypothetical protein